MTEAASEALDRQVRNAAFEFLAEQTRLHGETLSGARLLQLRLSGSACSSRVW
jgi:hypothetical protein